MHEDFAAKHAEWNNALNGEDRNAIFRQINEMTWDMASHRAIYEARRLNPKDSQGGLQVSPLLHNLLDHCFFRSQLHTIRRLAAKQATSPKRQVHSLRALLDDMQKHIHLLTRRNLLSLDNYPMDVEEVRRAKLAREHQHIQAGEDSWWTPPELDDFLIDRRHHEIDRLCGVTPATRNPFNQVSPAVLDRMIAALERVCGKPTLWVDKILAHAATPESRAIVNADGITLRLKDLWRAHEVVFRVANAMDCWFVSRATHMCVPSSARDPFRHLDRPLVTSDQLPQVRAAWKRFDEEAQTWSDPAWWHQAPHVNRDAL